MARTFTAKYDGSCSNCGVDIEPGDDVGYVDDEINCENCFEAAQE